VATHQWDAQTYDRISDPQVRWAAKVLDRLELRGDERVLDAGCGTGRISEQLLGRLPHGKLIGLDADAAMIDGARNRLARYGDRVDLVVADLLAPLPIGEPVDAVFSTAAFHWIKDHQRLFDNLAAVMRPGAQLVAQFGGGANIATVLAAIRAAGDDWEGPWCYATIEETEERLRRAGFTELKVWFYDEPTPFDTEAEFSEFLEKVCLGAHLARKPEVERAPFVRAVVANMPRWEIDYVRLNIVARRAPAS
jgi:trans-aconitate 2-methyltransferase